MVEFFAFSVQKSNLEESFLERNRLESWWQLQSCS